MKNQKKLILTYSPDYNSGKAEVHLDAADFLKSPEDYNHNLAKLAAGILATANDHIGQLGTARYLAPALDRDLQFKDISIFSYPKCRYRSDNVRLEKLGRRSVDFAFSISHVPMQIKGESFELILLTLRGTESASESLITDFMGTVGKAKTIDWCGYPAYTAFTLYAKKVLCGLQQYLHHNRAKFKYPKIKFFILGHSLGGAAAQLVAAKLTDRGKEVFGYTFASLNALTISGTKAYPNIWNFYNYYDTYGPRGRGAFGYRPAMGGKTIYHKLGHVILFKRNYNKIFHTWKWSKNHVMAGYCEWLGVTL
ncbi:hypothetical protein EII17_11505 [Clostridiales bacterium COT073_COT-073]|nr:hypothetical protein EII17_11505 [Clostridiales bacterium COT073_COT-073]